MKSKKILTILLSLAIMFTFMPAMAFASTGSTGNVSGTVVWGDGCNSVAVTSGGTTTTYTNIKKEQLDNGMWKAELDSSAYSYEVPVAEAYYWDLNGAKISYRPSDMPKTFAHGDFATYVNSSAVVYFAVKKGTNYAPYAQAVGRIDQVATWNGAFTGYDTFDADNKEEQKLTIGFEMKWVDGAETTGTSTNPFVYGTPDPVEVTVEKAPAAASDINLYWDEAKTNGVAFVSNTGVAYTGAAHKVVASSVEGYTTTFEVYNNGAWTAGDVSVTNVGDKVTFRVVVKNAKGETVTPSSLTGTKTAIVAPTDVSSGALAFGFIDTTDYGYNTDAIYKVAGSDYDAYEWVEAFTDSTNKAVKAAIAANKADLMAAFKAVTKVNAKASLDDPNEFTVSLTSDSDADITALDKTYKQLRANLGISSVAGLFGMLNSDADHSTGAVVYTNYKGEDKEVIFTKAITSKTYKGSKTTKKGKLKKNQTIQFTAETPNGTAVKYKLMNVNTSKITINSTTGKVTLKKGLAKGTYKFKVKAYIPNGGRDAYETQSVTIKVKK